MTLILPGAACSTFFDLKVIAGYLATSKKSGLLRCAFRCGSRVSTLAASIGTSTLEVVMSLSSQFPVPVTPWNSPRAVEILKCFPDNCWAECRVSTFHPDGPPPHAAAQP